MADLVLLQSPDLRLVEFTLDGVRVGDCGGTANSGGGVSGFPSAVGRKLLYLILRRGQRGRGEGSRERGKSKARETFG